MKISCINYKVEKIGKLIIQIFNKSINKVEGMKWSIPYSYEREKVRSMVLYCEMKLRKLIRKVVNSDIIQK